MSNDPLHRGTEEYPPSIDPEPDLEPEHPAATDGPSHPEPGYPAGTEAVGASDPGYPAGTEGSDDRYSGGTGGYPTDGGAEPAAEQPPPPWQRLGYASHLDMVNELARSSARASGASVVEQWAEDHLGKLTFELVPLDTKRPQRSLVTRQVNVKLGEEDFENLRRAAKHFRIARGTLGRIILSRAARDIVAREEAA